MSEKRAIAILVVSFGTTHTDTLNSCISATEKSIAESFPEYPVYRAFLSPTVMRILKEEEGICADTVPQALKRIENDGYDTVIVQPTLLLGGIEYDLLKEEVKTGNHLQIFLGRPLIENRRDCEVLADVIMEENPLDAQKALVLMGHGTEHEANEVYHMLQSIFDEKGYCCLVGTVEGTPSFEDAVEKLVQRSVLRADLLPLMFVAGDHAKNDMAGDESDSLQALICAEGIEARPILRGLGESRNVRKLYAERTKAVLKEAVC